MAHGYRKRVQHVAGFRVQVFKQVAHRGEGHQQRVGERMQAPGEAALVQPVLPPVLLHVVLGHDQVAAEKAGGHQGRRQHLCIGQTPA